MKKNTITIRTREDSLINLKKEGKGMLVLMDKLNEPDLKRLKELMDALDQDPIFVAKDAATCD